MTNVIMGGDEGVYLAYRGWDCRFEHDSTGRLILRSTGYSVAWRSREMEATCTSCVEEPPNEHCSCGVYALKDPANIRKRTRDKWIGCRCGSAQIMLIIGTVVLWGKIVEAEDGYRAQHARMEALFVPPEDMVPSHVEVDGKWRPVGVDIGLLARELQQSYNVPVIIDTLKAYYWPMPEPSYSATTGLREGRRSGVPQYDTKTGRVYKSKSAVGRDLASDHNLDPEDHFVWYRIIRIEPGRFRDATKAEVDAHNKAHPGSFI